MLDISIITSYFASPYHSNRAPYNEQLFFSLSKLSRVKVIRPISWLEILRSNKRFSRIIRDKSTWKGIEVKYPIFFFLPRVGHCFSGFLYYRCILRAFVEFNCIPDVFFSSWAYPDAYGVMKLARRHRRPLFMSVLGSDINFLSSRLDMRKQIWEVLSYSKAIFCPSNALRQKIIELGIEPHKIHVIYSGIDSKLFYERSKRECENQLGLTENKKRIVYIGNLKIAKGVIDYIKGVAKLADERRDFEALIIGKGEAEALVRDTIDELDLGDILNVVGEISHDELNAWLNASDCLCLPSYAEGLPNVVLEALVTKTNVVATNVGGIPEAVLSPDRYLFDPGNIEALCKLLNRALYDPEFRTLPAFNISSYDEVADKVLGIICRGIAQPDQANTAS